MKKQGLQKILVFTIGMAVFYYANYTSTRITEFSFQRLKEMTEDVALKGTQMIVKSLYRMAAIIFVVLLFYTIVVVFAVFHINQKMYTMSITDENTGVKNRNAYENYLYENRSKLFPCAVCIYVDANSLHELNKSRAKCRPISEERAGLRMLLGSETIRTYFDTLIFITNERMKFYEKKKTIFEDVCQCSGIGSVCQCGNQQYICKNLPNRRVQANRRA